MNRGVVGLVGAGAVGTALVRLLHDAGWRVGVVASRRLDSARHAVGFIGAGRPSNRNPEAAEDADLLLLAVPDRAIEEVARFGRASCRERV